MLGAVNPQCHVFSYFSPEERVSFNGGDKFHASRWLFPSRPFAGQR